KKVAIRTFQLKNQILIELEDDGIGFKPKRNSNGIGLNNMKERAKKINCELTIESHLGKGTKLSLRIPT
ncbi:MAG TPA: ATP-binding protein, partial [Flavobacteriaceae bacterium]|nr:ATP-binding protein [Flavobacteriaceae bacterium]